MGTREKLFRQKLANQIEAVLTSSEKVFSTEKLDQKWIETMLKETQELTSALTIYQFLHELPENESLQVEFLELKEEDAKNPVKEASSYGEEILKEIDEFESQEAEEVFVTEETEPEEIQVAEPVIAPPVEEKEEPQKEEKVMEVAEVETPEMDTAPMEEEVLPVEPEITSVPEAPKAEEKNNESEVAAMLTEEEKVKEINDSVALSETSLADKLRSKSIQKLAESIALNERFLYSNELFNGNMEAFKRALNELDHIASKEDAQRFIELQLQVENNWDLESETVQSFIALVERRFN